MAQLRFAFWDGVGGYADQDEHMADVYDEHIQLAQRLEVRNSIELFGKEIIPAFH